MGTGRRVLIEKTLESLQRKDNKSYSAFLGFDACIDNIVRVVKEKRDDGEPRFFETGRDFAEYIISRGSKSCGIELSTRVSKLGGNMVITSNALGSLGISIDCAGTFGLPDILPFFRSMSSNCKLHTIGDTITATALEFTSNKVIIFDPGPYDNLTWKSVVDITGKDLLSKLIMGKELVSFLNWSEIFRSTEIWEGFLEDIIPGSVKENSGEIFFTDISDCSRRSREEIRHIPVMLGRFRKYFKVVLSLNHNEADLLAGALEIPHCGRDDEFILSLQKKSGADILVIHRNNDAIGTGGKEVFSAATFHSENPVILTGGGDNFNAGLCLALLKGMNLPEALLTANAVAGYYVGNGYSPDYCQLTGFLELKLDS